MRSFVAIALEGEARRGAEALLEALRGAADADAVRWVRPEGLHVTLRFLGEIDEARVAPLAEGLRAAVASHPAFDLSLGALQGFPSAGRPRVLACEVAPVETLASLAEAVEGAVRDAGFAPESRPFRPHLTLGRVRRGRRVSLPEARVPDDAHTPVEQIVLFRSVLGASGARYTPLEQMALGPAVTPNSRESRN